MRLHPRAWEPLLARPTVILRRSGRFIVAALDAPHRALSTSPVTGGQRDDVRFIVNHQSCEATAHGARGEVLRGYGADGYHARIAEELGLPAAVTVTMGTAANMNHAALAVEADADVEVVAVVTAGVHGNAVCAGDPAAWRETTDGFARAIPGTINTIVLINAALAPAALARAVVTITEAKSAALQRLTVPSRQSADLATGTGTDQFCVAAPLASGRTLSSTSPHVKAGELIGLAVRRATLEALRWQNGLEVSYTRSLFHALSRYGVDEATFVDDVGVHLSAADRELLRQNQKAVAFEPLAGAAAHAMAAVLDRARHGVIPSAAAREAVLQQAAAIATAIAAKPGRWSAFREELHALDAVEPRAIVAKAVALGWSDKWGPA
jgi:adenosylcobinamide amidohydrolase